MRGGIFGPLIHGTRPLHAFFVAFFPIELPAARVPAACRLLQEGKVSIQMFILAHNAPEMIPNLFIDRFSRRTKLFPGALQEFFVNGKGEIPIHAHIIRVHILCVNLYFVMTGNSSRESCPGPAKTVIVAGL